MILTKENLQEWKAELNRKIKTAINYESDTYSDCLTDEEWINDYEGEDVDQAIEDEIDGSDWEENGE